MNMKDMLSKLNNIESKQVLNEEAETKAKVDENISLNADGDDAMHLILKLAGLPTDDAPGMDSPMGSPSTDIVPAGPVVDVPPIAPSAGSVEIAPTDSEMDMMDAELDEFANTPAGSSGPATFGMDAALPSGNDLHKAKGMHKHGYHQGDNPLAMEEIAKLEGKLAKMFETMSKE